MYRESKIPSPFPEKHSNLRAILTHIYLYGFYNIAEIKKHYGLAERTYHKLRTTSMSLLLDTSLVEKHRYTQQIKHDPFFNPKNFLLASYFIKVFNVTDIIGYFYIRPNLSVHKDTTISKLEADVYPLTSKQLRNQLKYLVDAGHIIENNKQKPYTYKLPADIFSGLSRSELLTLYHAVDFYKNVALISVLGQQLQNTLENHLNYKHQQQISSKHSMYLYRQFLLSKALDDELIAQILEFIKLKQTIIIEWLLKTNNNPPIYCVPLKIITEYIYGRQYVLVINATNNIQLIKINQIGTIKVAPQPLKDIDLDNRELDLQKIWSVSLPLLSTKPKLVEIDFHFTSDNFSYRFRRLQEEGLKNGATLVEIAPMNYLYRINLIDPRELLPWIMSFGESACPRASSEHSLYDDICQHWKEALANYECL